MNTLFWEDKPCEISVALVRGLNHLDCVCRWFQASDAAEESWPYVTKEVGNDFGFSTTAQYALSSFFTRGIFDLHSATPFSYFYALLCSRLLANTARVCLYCTVPCWPERVYRAKCIGLAWETGLRPRLRVKKSTSKSQVSADFAATAFIKLMLLQGISKRINRRVTRNGDNGHEPQAKNSSNFLWLAF